MQAEIRAFLADGYYGQGVALLRRCPDVPPTTIRYFEAALAKPYLPTAVEQELSALLRGFLEVGSSTVGSGQPEEEAGENQRLDDEPAVMGDQVKVVGAVSGSFWGGLFAGKETVPQEVWKLYERAVGLHKEQAHLHPLMVAAAKEGKRGEARKLAAQIMDEIIPTLDEIYDAAREWGKSGKMPPAVRTDDVVRQTVKKMQRIEYCKQRMSRIRSWLKAGEREMKVEGKKQVVKLEFADRRELDKELLEREVEMKELREELGIGD